MLKKPHLSRGARHAMLTANLTLPKRIVNR